MEGVIGGECGEHTILLVALNRVSKSIGYSSYLIPKPDILVMPHPILTCRVVVLLGLLDDWLKLLSVSLSIQVIAADSWTAEDDQAFCWHVYQVLVVLEKNR